MRKGTSVIWAFVLGTVHVAAVTMLYPHVPVMFWSNRPLFSGKNAYINAPLNESELAITFNNVMTRNMLNDHHHVLSRFEIDFITPEILCVFLRDDLRSEQVVQLGKTSFIAKSIHESKSSVVLPHTTRTSSLLNALSESQPSTVSVEDVETWMQTSKGQSLLHDGKTDLLIVQVPTKYTLAEADELMQQASDSLIAASQNRVDFAFTGDEAVPTEVGDAPYGRRLSEQRHLASNEIKASDLVCDVGYLIGVSGNKAFCYSHRVHMTPEILTGLIFGFLFLFLTYVGLSVLGAIQTPTRYPSHGPPKGKEF